MIDYLRALDTDGELPTDRAGTNEHSNLAARRTSPD
jgi:hypothetical protein